MGEEERGGRDGGRREAEEEDGGHESRLITCGNAALPAGTRGALTLRSLTGKTTAEVARAFLVAEAAVAQRGCMVR